MSEEIIPVGSVASICQAMRGKELAEYLNARGIDFSISQSQAQAQVDELAQGEGEQVLVSKSLFLHCCFFGISKAADKHIVES